MSIITKKWTKKFDEAEYLDEIIKGLESIQKENNYTDEEMDNDLDVALWRAYVYNNMDRYEYYELSEKTLAKVKDRGVKSGVWCYRYSFALVYMRKFDEALEYSRLGTKVEPDYPWGWLQLGRLCYKFNLLDEAFRAIDKGLELVPNNYEFLTLKDDIENNRGYAYTNSHYIDEEVDKNILEDRGINIDDEELYNQFLNKNELEKKLDILDSEGRNQEIINIINSLPKEELTYDILGKLARAYNNNEEYEKGKEILLSVKNEGENDSLWNFRIGYSCYYSGQLEEAQRYLERCLELNPELSDVDFLLRYTYSDLGEKKIEEEKMEEALEYFKKAREISKDIEGIIFSESNLAWIYDYINEHEKSYEYLKNVISLGRDDIWVHSALGFCLGRLEEYDEAIKHFEKAIEMGRNDSWIFARLGDSYKELKKYDKALEAYLKGLEIDENNIWLNSEVAWIYYAIKDECNIGLKYLEKVRELGRDDIWLNSELGWLYNHLQDYEKALSNLKRAEELGRDDEWINGQLGYSLAKLEKHQKAIKYYEKAIKMVRNDSWIFARLGDSYKKLKKYDKALEAYLKGLEIDENDIGLNSEVAWIYDTIKDDYITGLKYLEKARELGRDDIWLNSELGWLYNHFQDYEKALFNLKRAEELGRDDEWINGQLGYSLSKSEKYQEALKHFEKAKFINPNNDWISYNLASCYRKLGEVQKAIEILKLSLEKGVYRGWIELELAYCYALIDEKEKAQKYLDEADLYIGEEILESSEAKKNYDIIKQLISNSNCYFRLS